VQTELAVAVACSVVGIAAVGGSYPVFQAARANRVHALEHVSAIYNSVSDEQERAESDIADREQAKAGRETALGYGLDIGGLIVGVPGLLSLRRQLLDLS
jgi:hypothetical protein